MDWPLPFAKGRLSEVVEQAIKKGPQEITRQGKKVAVVLSMDDYRKMRGRKDSLADYFRNSPLRDLLLERSP